MIADSKEPKWLKDHERWLAAVRNHFQQANYQVATSPDGKAHLTKSDLQQEIIGVDPAAPGSEKSILTVRQTINSWSDCIKFVLMIVQNNGWGFKLLDVVDLPNGQTSATFERVK